MIALFLAHEVLRWFAPWGSWLGGPGFTYQRVDDDDKNGSTEMKDFSPENKIPWMNSRAPVVRTAHFCSRSHCGAQLISRPSVCDWRTSNRHWW